MKLDATLVSKISRIIALQKLLEQDETTDVYGELVPLRNEVSATLDKEHREFFQLLVAANLINVYYYEEDGDMVCGVSSFSMEPTSYAGPFNGNVLSFQCESVSGCTGRFEEVFFE